MEMNLKQIELMGKVYTAERLTKVALLGVLSKFSIKKANNEAEMLEVFTDPEVIDRVAYWLSYIFPEMAKDGIVWYGLPSHPKSGIDLELNDLLALLVKLTEWATGEAFPDVPTPAPLPTVPPEIEAITAQIEALSKQLDAMRPKPPVDSVAAMDQVLAQSLLNS